MHELSLAEDMIQLVEETARRENARRVKTVVVEIGRLSAVEPEALGFAFDVVKLGGPAAEAVLKIIDVPGEGTCGACGQVAVMAESFTPCPACGSFDMQPTAGTRMWVKEIEIEPGGA